MDLGVLGLESLVTSSDTTKHKSLSGSVLSKQDRQQQPQPCQDDITRVSKIPKSDDKATTLQQVSPLLRSKEQMLSFSSVKHEGNGGLVDTVAQNQSVFACFQQHPSSISSLSPGYGNGSSNASVHGALTGVRGPFTPSQWMELEHQALIYKYITSNVAVPSILLISLKKSLYPFGLGGPGTRSFPSFPLGWGTFHLGYPGSSNDPEPGRCRRTDGKKWRCSRDAVADQKYCERHINRGRHRSRKPVEGQTGHAATRTTNSKVTTLMTSTMSTLVPPGGGKSNSIAIAQQHLKNMQPTAASGSSDIFVNRAQDHGGLSMLSSTINLKSDESIFNIPNPEIAEESPRSEFGLVSSDSLLNPSHRSSYMNCKNYESFINFSDQENRDEHSFCHFIDELPKDQSSHSKITWPDELKSHWTQLSMAIPIASDFSSSSSSPTREKLPLSPLRLSCEFDPNQMSFGTNCDLPDSNQKQTNWIPISWGSSTGDPLGEVLTTSTGNKGSCSSSSAFNSFAEAWDGGPQLGSSSTVVLQKPTLGPLSNSSTSGSSPRTESKNSLGGSLCDNIPGSTIVISSPIPTL